MQQRKSRATSLLPVVESDSSVKRKAKRTKKPPPTLMTLVGKLLVSLSALALLALYLQQQTLSDSHYSNPLLQYIPADDDRPLFASLPNDVPLVALYFAASWCPMSTPVTKLLDDTFRDLLSSESSDLALVHVSSDVSEADLQHYLRPHWQFVPFESPDRNELKRYFGTCAKREQEDLKVDRKRGIPTLILLGHGRRVLTYHGIEDVQERGVEAVEYWKNLADIATALESKY